MSENPGHVQTARDRAVQSRSLQRDQHPQDLLGALVSSPPPTAISSPARPSRSMAAM